jgi:hypothetical protein
MQVHQLLAVLAATAAAALLLLLLGALQLLPAADQLWPCPITLLGESTSWTPENNVLTPSHFK